MRGLLEQEIVRRGLSGAVDLLGFEANPHRRMREADVYVLTSDYEGLPNALIEAQSLGLPAVSTRCPSGPDEIIQDGTTGLLAPVGDAVAISELLDRLLSRPEATRAMGQAAAARMVDHFDCRAAVHAWESFLEETVASA